MVKILLWANIFMILLGFGAYLSPHVSPEGFWIFSILGLFYPWLVFGNLLFVGIWAVLRKRYFIYSLAWLLFGWGQFTSLVAFRAKPIHARTETELRVMTYNCRNLIKPGSEKVRVTNEELTGLINEYEPDVLCFQEFPVPSISGQFADAITHGTGFKYFFQDQSGQLAIFSKYPISKKRAKYYTNHSNGYLSADITKGGKTFRLFNIHLQSNAVSTIADKVASEGKIQEKETWLTIRGMIGKYRNAARKRAMQAAEIAEHIQRSPNPVIICGDFNDVPQSNAYHLLSAGRKDTFKEAGVGLGTTYAGSIPALRIDYIFGAPDMKTLEFEIIKADFSDHYPVFARLQPH
ncbi:MAG: endonuclease/exonuclease/phosphatase family protein [Saprospiraceae bacterium]|nr:endonuclease/exonuclease/phosphatase family protein [Saprospiraceae bacterium]MCB9324312.1 endonuclease/exonuclease/phosphatase family protein [Lewinellaceae bacterium]